MKRAIFHSVLTFCSLVACNAAEEAHPGLSAGVDILNQYVWRAYAISKDSVVIQPYLAMDYRGFQLSFWGNYDFDRPGSAGADWTETDLTLSWTTHLYGPLHGGIGMIYYALDSLDDSTEVFASLSADLSFISVSAIVFREVSHYPGWWIQAGISRSIALPAHLTLDLSAGLLALFSEDSGAYPDPRRPGYAYKGLHSGILSTVLQLPVTSSLSIAGVASYTFPVGGGSRPHLRSLSADHSSDHLYGGVRLTLSF